MQELKEILGATFESETNGSLVKQTTGQKHTPAVKPSIPDPSIAPGLRTALRKMAQEEAKRIFVKQVGTSMQKGAEVVL